MIKPWYKMTGLQVIKMTKEQSGEILVAFSFARFRKGIWEYQNKDKEIIPLRDGYCATLHTPAF